MVSIVFTFASTTGDLNTQLANHVTSIDLCTFNLFYSCIIFIDDDNDFI